jgi:3-deoxy-D-manno-octulosonic-acid transferase
LKVSSIRFSRADVAIVDDKKVLIIDNVGMLSTLYKYGNVAYIGGGFGKGIHNILEAAVFGQPVLFGPNYLKFSEAVDLINEKGAFTFSDHAQMEELLNRFFENEEELDKVSSISMNFVKMRIGATEKILNKIS